MGGKPITREDARRMISAVVDDGLRLDGLAKREGITPGGVSFRLAAIGCGYREICKHAREGKTTAQVLDMVWPLEKPAAPPSGTLQDALSFLSLISHDAQAVAKATTALRAIAEERTKP